MADIEFKCCRECGSAEDVLKGTERCPGCGAPYSAVPSDECEPDSDATLGTSR